MTLRTALSLDEQHMSRPYHDGPDVAGYGGGAYWSGEALAEARMLIERNEPIRDSGGAAIVGVWYDHTPHGHGLRETRLALAEALAAFVAE